MINRLSMIIKETFLLPALRSAIKNSRCAAIFIIFTGRPTAIAIFIAHALLGKKNSCCAAIFIIFTGRPTAIAIFIAYALHGNKNILDAAVLLRTHHTVQASSDTKDKGEQI